MGLVPGTSFYLVPRKFTKQKGFGTFDIAGYWRRKYRGKQEDVALVSFDLCRHFKTIERELQMSEWD